MNKIRAFIKDDIEKVEEYFLNLFDNNISIINDIDEFIHGPSKRIRSIACILYLKANNAIINNEVYNVLAAGEIIHNASLLHDDVIDDAEQRRGITTINYKYNSKISVLSGDYLLTKAVKQLLNLKNNEILKMFLLATEEMSKAELKQYANRDKKVNIKDYLDIINGKTASLFKSIFKSTALLTELNMRQAEKFGELFGCLFQINNDTKEDSVINDKKNGINTSLDILGIEKTQDLKDNYKKELREINCTFPNKKYTEKLEVLIKLL